MGLCSLAINLFIVIVRLLSWNNDQQWDSANQVLIPAMVHGWLFLAIVGPMFLLAIVYYFVTFYGSRFTVLRLVGARPVLEELETHHNRYGYKRFARVEFIRAVSIFDAAHGLLLTKILDRKKLSLLDFWRQPNRAYSSAGY